MSTTKEPTLSDFGQPDESPSEVSAEKLGVYYRQFGGDVRMVADLAGVTPDDVRERLAECQLHGDGIEPDVLADKLPHEVGLDPLGCGECGAVEIVQHPCPDCGFDPRGGATDA
jgi:hypothetical protein